MKTHAKNFTPKRKLHASFVAFTILLMIAGCGSQGQNQGEQLRVIKQQQLDMFNQVVRIYDNDLSYAEVQEKKSEVMSGFDDTKKQVKALKETMDKQQFESIQKEFNTLVEDAKKREREAAKAWGKRNTIKGN